MQKAFGLWSAVFIGIGSMVGAGIFIIIGEAGSIAGNIVWLSFAIGGVIALLSGYSLAKLAVRYPSRGGIIEYLVQCYGEGFFSGSMGVLFYLAQLISLAAVAKSFGSYASTFLQGGYTPFWSNVFGVLIVILFAVINLVGANFVAKSENIIVIIKLAVLSLFAITGFFFIDPELLSAKDMPPLINMLFAVGLTFFAYQGFSVITNTVEDMENPSKTVLKAMIIAISIVAILYISISIVVLGTLPLPEVIKAKEYALAEATKPIFGDTGFRIMAAAALVSTASAINATLYSVTEIGYTLAKKGELPKIYEYNVFNSYEGLIVSTIITLPMILFLNLSEITTIAALCVLAIQALVHIGHLFKTEETKAHKHLISLAILGMVATIVLTLMYTYKKMPQIPYYIMGALFLAFMTEVTLRLVTKRIILRQTIHLPEYLKKKKNKDLER
ncbi:APC family permease [Nitrosophilus alvini]|uniref:APC family permease n=1 Tax=Nitrosophilus alvini TaxID=2714855 RepID=UPI00190C96DB|nr:APC family permease [Nitrosophilus alvini]